MSESSYLCAVKFSNSKNIFRQLIQLRQPIKTDIYRVVEENYTSPISLDELAYLSGRSLSSFKGELQDIYGAPPARWIRERRLSKAHEMLRSSSLSVADVTYSLSFENPTHFSRTFKQHPVAVVNKIKGAGNRNKSQIFCHIHRGMAEILYLRSMFLIKK